MGVGGACGSGIANYIGYNCLVCPVEAEKAYIICLSHSGDQQYWDYCFLIVLLVCLFVLQVE